MATLVLGTVGTLVGGPLGGAIGTLIGRSIDGEIFGAGSREGPRLDELSASTSSYGQAIARHYGRVRSAGSIFWATDFQESSETSGGKGKPKVTTYSYSVSFAVALSSRPIDGIGRIWADGNLLRGAAGDLKTGGSMRLYEGHGDQPLDPLLAAALGSQCSAHRGTAYAVFEDLQLAEFGNRIPALTFEIVAGPTEALAPDLLALANAEADTGVTPEGMEGFSYSGGSVRQVLELFQQVQPIAPDSASLPLRIQTLTNSEIEPTDLPESVAALEGDFGVQNGSQNSSRSEGRYATSVRYYDPARDFQTGIQTSSGRADTSAARPFEFPAVLSAGNARALAHSMSQLRQNQSTHARWRMAELDPSIAPGSLVQVPGNPSIWQVDSWEWSDAGVELELSRHLAKSSLSGNTDAGAAIQANDEPLVPTRLRAFELPWDGNGTADVPQIFAAATAVEGRWGGASISRVSNGNFEEIATATPPRAISGATLSELSPSNSLMLEPHASLTLTLTHADMALAGTDITGLANGENRMLVGDEVIQFLRATQQSEKEWGITGLLRGRGGTESAAQTAHPAGTAITLLDNRLTSLAGSGVNAATDEIAALALGDETPVIAQVENAGVTRKPLTPVHSRLYRGASGDVSLFWTRRARGQWGWSDEVDTPLVEQSETYQVGVGEILNPVMQWQVNAPQLVLTGAEFDSLSATHPQEALWVRQVGAYAKSDALFIHRLD